MRQFLGGPVRGVTITPQRPTDDGMGNLTFNNLDAIDDVVIDLQAPSPVSDSVITQGGALYVPRGSDIANGDRVMLGDKPFVVIGAPMWDMDHPFTGEDFGYVEVRIQWGG